MDRYCTSNYSLGNEGGGGKKDWLPSENFPKLLTRIETTLAIKLDITLFETRSMLACKKAYKDRKEIFLFKKKKKREENVIKNTDKIKKHSNNIARGLVEINQIILDLQQTACKIDCYVNKIEFLKNTMLFFLF